MRYFLLVVFFSLPSAWAGSGCAFRDLRSLLGPPLDQGDTGHCFAHSAASLIGAKLGVRVSPLQLATNYVLANPEEITHTADPELRRRITPALLAAWKNDRSAEPENYAPETILTEKGLLNTGGEEWPTLIVANFLGLCRESRLPGGRGVHKKYLEEILKFHEERWKRGIPPEEMSNPIGEVKDPVARAKAWSFRHWVESTCGRTIKPSRALLPGTLNVAKNLKQFRRFEALHLFAPDQAHGAVMKAVDRQLDRGMPVAIGYSLADIMPEGFATGAVEEVDHSSVLAGRKKMGGKCYYYLRNSFGDALDGYHSRFKGRLEQGGVWVLPEEIPSLYSAVWLE